MIQKMYKGIFWIKQKEEGRFIPITVKAECDEYGNLLDERVRFSSKSGESFNHQEEWEIFEAMPGGEYRGLPYNYYPRGRVEIKNKKATVYLNPVLCTEYIKRLIFEKFGLFRDGINVRFVADGSSHYDYTAEIVIPRCTMCKKQLDEWDMQEDFYFKRRIGYGSKYDFHIFEARLCCDCFDSVLDKILPMFKVSPLSEYE